MKLDSSRKSVVATALALGLLSIGSASAAPSGVINFIELPNDGGIQMTSSGVVGSADVTIQNPEEFHISSPAVPSGYSPDAILGHIGVSRTSPGHLFALVESIEGPVSDYVWVHTINGPFTVIDFVSASAGFVVPPGTPETTIVEDGTLQFIGNYTNDKGELIQINVQSSVPDAGSTMALLGLALGGIAAVRRQPSRQ